MLTDVGRVVGGPKDKLRCTVVPRADVADVGLARDKNLGRPEVAELENAGSGVKEEVLGLDVPVTDADRVDVHERTEELVHVEFDLQHRHGLLKLGVVTASAIHGLGDVFENKVEVHFIFLLRLMLVPKAHVGIQAQTEGGQIRTFSPLE